MAILLNLVNLINFTTVNDVVQLRLCCRLTFYRVHAWRNYVVMNGYVIQSMNCYFKKNCTPL